MKLKDLVPPEVEHDRFRCACRRTRGCWPLSEADIKKQDERWEAQEFTDELDVMKRHGRKPDMSLSRIVEDMSGIFDCPQYEMTYAQKSVFTELQGYEDRRHLLLGIPQRGRDTLAKRAGYSRIRASLLHEQWNRRSVFFDVLGGTSK